MLTERLFTTVAAAGLGLLLSCTGTLEDVGSPLGPVAGAHAAAGVPGAGGGIATTSGGSSPTTIVNGGASAGAQSTQSSGGTTGQGGSPAGSGGNGGAAGGSSSGAGGGAGASSCPSGQLACSGACVDTMTSATNCGACAKACPAGSSCVSGACACPGGRAACGSACVDLSTDAANCGTCGMACPTGRSCQQGMCQCAAGQTACGASCVNLMTDGQNCGACATQCASGEACSAGKCSTSAGGGVGADSCMGLAQNLTLSQIALYQTVKIPLMQTGSEVAVSARKADVVAGRDAVFRLFVTVGSGWAARELSGRVIVDNGGVADTYYAKKTISASSQEATLDSTFVVTVPKDKITRTTRYQAEIVECGTGSGTAQTPRFPATDSVALGARETGTLKIRVVPLSANSMQPDTSDTALGVYKALFLAMYPITSIEFSVGSVVTVPNAQDWTKMLDLVRAKRQTDAPAADIYYYGLLKPAATLREYCGSGCTAGIGYVPGNATSAAQRAALGLAFADAVSAETMAHEVGHNHGRNHAPCVQGGSISGVDGSFPYSNGAIGVYGWDNRSSKLIAPDRTDIMGYCNSKWISDYTYEGILKRVASVNGAPTTLLVPNELVHPWRILLLDGKGPRWGIPIDEPAAPAGVAEPAEILDATGRVVATVTVYRTEISDVGAFSFEVPVPEPGWESVRVAGSAPIAFAP